MTKFIQEKSIQQSNCSIRVLAAYCCLISSCSVLFLTTWTQFAEHNCEVDPHQQEERQESSMSSSSSTPSSSSASSASSFPTTLKICDIDANIPNSFDAGLREAFERSIPVKKVYKDKKYKIVQSSTLEHDQNITLAPNGFVSTCSRAYNQHHHLVLRPDDVWQGILTQFSLYVQGNSEDLRDSFVDFQGKKQLTIVAAGTLFTVDFGHLANRMVDEQIATNIKDPSIRDWLIPDFSTTTTSDRVSASVSVMSALQNYFSYKMMLLCGIPSVTLMGTVEDWQKLRQRIDRLPEFEIDGKSFMHQWHDMLVPILDKFLETKQGNDTSEFWSKILHHIGGGSGPSYISGWITAFSVFTDKGKWQGDVRDIQVRDYKTGKTESYRGVKIDTNDLAQGILAVPVEIDDNGAQYKGHMFAGQVVAQVEDMTLHARNDWCIAVEEN